MPINHWLSPYMMEASAKTSLPTTTAAAVCCGQSTAFGLNLNNEDEEADSGGLPREPLFEKPLTPSDVGKLNRLVIPKQHAERHFPLNGGESGGGEKGLLLGFEDEVGKSWRFRYSYWNSSQSYVLTKGWSRFVKEKRLDAGDIVLFARHPKDVGRLFIGWRRRGGQEGGGVPQQPSGSGWSRLLYAAHPYPSHSSNSVFYQPHSCPHAENENENEGREKNGNSKRLRLFGVNLEWDDDESDPKVLSSQGRSNEEEPYHEHYSSHGRSVSYVCDSTNHI